VSVLVQWGVNWRLYCIDWKTIIIQNPAKFENTLGKVWVKYHYFHYYHHQRNCH
jgi:hypothetical protein